MRPEELLLLTHIEGRFALSESEAKMNNALPANRQGMLIRARTKPTRLLTTNQISQTRVQSALEQACSRRTSQPHREYSESSDRAGECPKLSIGDGDIEVVAKAGLPAVLLPCVGLRSTLALSGDADCAVFSLAPPMR